MYNKKLLLLFISSTFLSISIPSYSKNVNQTNIYLNSGKKHYQKKEFSLAISDLRKALKLEPQNKDIILSLRNATRDYGIQLLEQNKKDEGRKLLLESAKLSFSLTTNEEKIVALSMLKAVDYIQQEEFDKVINLLEPIKNNKTIKDDASSLLIQAYIGKSIKLTDTDKYSEIRENMTKSKQLLVNIPSKENPTRYKQIVETIQDLYDYSSVGKIGKEIDEGKNIEAEKELEKIIKSEPNNSHAYSFMGLAKMNLKKLDESISYYEKSIKLNPDDIESNYNLACLYSLTNKKDLAINTLKKAIRIKPELKEEATDDKDFDNIRDLNEFQELLKE